MLYNAICTIFFIPLLQRRLILERHLPKIRQLLDLRGRKMTRMILIACSIFLFCLVLERGSDNSSKLVCSLSLLQFRETNSIFTKMRDHSHTTPECNREESVKSLSAFYRQNSKTLLSGF